MPRRRGPSASPGAKLKRPSELEQLRQENSKLKKRLSETEEYYSDKMASLSSALEEGKRQWEKTSKENVELRARADVEALKMQRMEERIRLLESALRRPGVNADDFLDDQSLRRTMDTRDRDHNVFRKEPDVFQYRQQPPPQERTPTEGYARYTMGGLVFEERLPKQYRSTGDLRFSQPAPTSPVRSPTMPRPGSANKIYWVDDPPLEEPPRRPASQQESTFEPPKVHPMIVKMATKRKRNERSKTIGMGDLRRSNSDERKPVGRPGTSDGRGKTPWLQRMLGRRPGQHGDAGPAPDTKPPPARRPDVASPEPRARSPVRPSSFARSRRYPSDGDEEPPNPPPERPPTSVLIESIRQRVREFSMESSAPADGRRSAELPEPAPVENYNRAPPRPASSMELGRSENHGHPITSEWVSEEDQKLKHRVQQMLDRQAARLADSSQGRSAVEEKPMRPPSHGPVRAVHNWTGPGGNDPSNERWEEPNEEMRVPPLDLSKLKPEKIVKGTGLPTEMRNYADELINKYMSSLAVSQE